MFGRLIQIENRILRKTKCNIFVSIKKRLLYNGKKSSVSEKYQRYFFVLKVNFAKLYILHPNTIVHLEILKSKKNS